MNYIDIIIIIILASSILFGFSNGFVKEVASLAALVIGIWGAVKYSSLTAQKLYDFFDISGQFSGIVAFIITFGLIVAVILFIGLVFNKIVNLTPLGLLNKFFGSALGLLKSVLILSVVFYVLNAIDAKKPFLPKKKIEQSAFYNPIADIIPTFFSIIDKETFKQGFDKFKKNPNYISI